MNRVPTIRRVTVPAIVAAAIATGAAAAASPALAQQTEQVQPQTHVSTVHKNRAPVAHDLLAVHLPRPKEFTLPSSGSIPGAHILVVEDHRLPLVTISVSLKAGTLFDAADHPGVASMTADLLTEGTERRTSQQIAADTDRIGASVRAEAGGERATVSVSGLSENVDQLVDILSDVLLHPTFPDDRLEQVKFRAVQLRQQRATNPQFLAGQLTRQELYGADTAYGRPDPTPEQIRAITPADLRAFYQAHYLNSPATLIGIAGDVDAKEIDRKLETALHGWGAGGAPATSPSVDLAALPPGSFTPKEKTAIYLVDRPGSAQTVLSFANLGIRRTDPDYFPLLVANYILGGGSNGRLFQKLREDKGYTYGAYTTLSVLKYPGTWGAGASVRNAVTTPAVGEFFNEFVRIQDQPVANDELEFARRSIVGSFALALESPSDILGRLITVADYDLPADYWDTFPKKVDAVTAADIQRVSQKYLGKGRIQLIAVGQRDQIESGLATYGPVTVLTPEQVLNPGHS